MNKYRYDIGECTELVDSEGYVMAIHIGYSRNCD
jgi:hypothetical protein